MLKDLAGELMHGGGVPDDDCCNTTVSEEKSRPTVVTTAKIPKHSKGVEFVEACPNKPWFRVEQAGQSSEEGSWRT